MFAEFDPLSLSAQPPRAAQYYTHADGWSSFSATVFVPVYAVYYTFLLLLLLPWPRADLAMCVDGKKPSQLFFFSLAARPEFPFCSPFSLSAERGNAYTAGPTSQTKSAFSRSEATAAAATARQRHLYTSGCFHCAIHITTTLGGVNALLLRTREPCCLLPLYVVQVVGRRRGKNLCADCQLEAFDWAEIWGKSFLGRRPFPVSNRL